MQVFEQLLRCKAFPMKERMRCLLSVVEIVHEQGDALNVDRRAFYTHLYAALHICPVRQLADLPADDASADADVVTEADLALAGTDAPLSASAPDGEETIAVLIAKAAHAMLMDMKVGDIPRLAAFVKRLCSVALHADTDLSLAAVCLVNRCVAVDSWEPRCSCLLWGTGSVVLS